MGDSYHLGQGHQGREGRSSSLITGQVKLEHCPSTGNPPQVTPHELTFPGCLLELISPRSHYGKMVVKGRETQPSLAQRPFPAQHLSLEPRETVGLSSWRGGPPHCSPLWLGRWMEPELGEAGRVGQNLVCVKQIQKLLEM